MKLLAVLAQIPGCAFGFWRGALAILLLGALAEETKAACFSAAPSKVCIGVTNLYAVIPPVFVTSYTWSITSDNAGTTFVGTTNTESVNVVSTGQGSFNIQCVVVSGTNSITCATHVSVREPMSIIPLTNQIVCASSPVTFATDAEGTGPFSYQWRKDGAAIAGATTDSLTLPNPQSKDQGIYSIEVTGPCSSATNSASLIIAPQLSITCPTNVMLSCISELPAPDTNVVIVDPPSAVVYFGSITETTNCLTTVTRVYQVISSCNATSTCQQIFQIQNTNPPTITCSSNRIEECGSSWTFDEPMAVSFCGDTNIVITSETVTNQLIGQTFSATRTWHATDSCSNTASCSQTITIVDTTPPVITCSSNLVVECAAAAGTPVAFTTTAQDACDTNVTVICTPPSGSLFAQGTNIVVCVATDQSGNSNVCSFTVTVRDTTPPVITCSSNLVVECAAAAGTPVAFTTTAQDACDTNVTVICTPPSGSLFAQGTNIVVCVATDQSGNSNVCSFTVTVKVATPQLNCPSNIVAECSGPSGTPVSFTVTALGSCNTNVTIVSTPPSGSLFPRGTNIVMSVAIDELGNSNVCTFTVTVQDTTPPHITCPSNISVAELPRDSGSSLVIFSAPVATDLCAGSATVTSQPASGTLFPVGSNTVVSTAVDPSGNSNTCSFIVRVIPYHLVVTTAADSGPGSLRQAIIDANDAEGENLITFDPGISGQSIHLLAALPQVTSPLIIDGSTGGANPASAIDLDGGGGSNAFDGLVISAGNSIVRGLSLHGFATAIRLTGLGTNVVQANYIGSDLSGANFPGNSGDGIFIDNSRNLIGGDTNGYGNLIVNNGHNGITVNSGIGNVLLENNVFSNGGLGIDLGNDGVTLNDDGDVDSGPNNLQNFPVLTDAQSADGTTTIYGSLTSDVSQNFRVEFYLNDAADPTGYGQGQQFIGATVVAVHNGGPDAFTASFPVTATFTQFITAIATDPRGNSSEFSKAVQVRTPPVLGEPPSSTNTTVGGSATFCATASGTAPILYQWRLNGVNIPGATNSCYTIPDAEIGNLGSYSVIVGNELGAIGTQTASLGAGLPTLNGADNFSNRVLLTGLSGTIEGNNHGATLEPGEPLHAGKIGGKSVWYSWTAPVTGIATFRTVGSTFNTLLAVYIGTNVTNLISVISDIDHGGFYTSSARFNIQQGDVVAIAIDGYGGAEGDFVLGWDEEDTPKLLPFISVHPVNQTVLPGANATFFVQAQRVCGYGHTNCPAPTHYPGDEIPQLTNQWYFEGLPIAGATSSSLTVSNVQKPNLGAYHMRVATPYQYVDSHDAILQINVTGSDSQDVQAFDKLLDSELSETLHIGVPPGVAGRGTTGGFGPLGGSSVVRGFTGTQIFNTTGAATSPGETICGVIGGASEWITFVADTSGTLFLNTDGSSYDTVMAVFRRSATNASVLEQITCDNNSGVDGKDSAVNFPVEVGGTNFIVVDGVNGVTGILQLNYSLVTSTVIKMLAPTIQGLQHLQVVGRTNLNFTLQCSSNMQSWTSLLTTNAPTGVFDYVDPASSALPFRYYRAILLP